MTLAIYHHNALLDAQSMGASFNSDPVKIKNFKGYSVQLACSGSPSGAFKLQASNDADENAIVNWVILESNCMTF